ncbi:MAG: bifunctional enoyl-CoA hydratase/phosphate acetyltransferase [Bacilli bacterium]|nr:bifunctional enoyl-CoA hydratase/phosphate acetyltransferase [Bacilli bacterium]
MINDFKQLLKRGKKLPCRRLAVAGADDADVISAVYQAEGLGLVSPILIGNEIKIKELLRKIPSKADIIKADRKEDAAAQAVKMIRDGKADFLMKGMIDTGTLLKAVVNRDTGIRKAPVLSHVAVLSVPNFNRLLIATDCAMIITPTCEEKIRIIENALTVARALGIIIPKVGVLSLTEKINPKIPSSIEADMLAQYFAPRDDVIVEGPFALDNVISENAARRKGITGKVAGAADILVFPGIEAGNIFYKTVVYFAGCVPTGIIVGAKCPIVLTSRADSEQAKLYSIILAMVVHGETVNISH